MEILERDAVVQGGTSWHTLEHRATHETLENKAFRERSSSIRAMKSESIERDEKGVFSRSGRRSRRFKSSHPDQSNQ
jgi:hypothetical protein